MLVILYPLRVMSNQKRVVTILFFSNSNMTLKAASPEQYINWLSVDRKEAVAKLRDAVLKNLPKGFKEEMSYGMLGYVVPLELFPAGYHCNPKLPLPFINIASQKNFIAFYHMGIYANTELLKWFTAEYLKHSPAKSDMGKACIRFKKAGTYPL